MNLSRLRDPFPAGDIEWRVSHTGMGRDGKRFCMALAYITARAIQERLDKECGPENWKLEEPRILELAGKPAFACGISIRVNDEWITKWDVCEPTKVPGIDPAKGGFSGAMKRAGAQWGIGRYLYYLDETFAEVSESKGKGWNYAKIPPDKGGGGYYWLPPRLPEFALPKEPESEVSQNELTALKKCWKVKFMPDDSNTQELREGFERLVKSVVGDFPVADHACWTKEAVVKVSRQIEATADPLGPDANVPFGAGGGK